MGMVCMLCGVTVFAYLTGTIAAVLAAVNARKARVAAKLRVVDTVIRRKKASRWGGFSWPGSLSLSPGQHPAWPACLAEVQHSLQHTPRESPALWTPPKHGGSGPLVVGPRSRQPAETGRGGSDPPYSERCRIAGWPWLAMLHQWDVCDHPACRQRTDTCQPGGEGSAVLRLHAAAGADERRAHPHARQVAQPVHCVLCVVHPGLTSNVAPCARRAWPQDYA
jgi:hypothetical protein